MEITADHWPCSQTEFMTLLSVHEPTVFRAAAATWNLPAKGTDFEILDWLTSIIGHRTVQARMGLPGDRGLFTATTDSVMNPSSLSGKRIFREIAAEMKLEASRRSGHVLYVQSEIRKELPELRPFIQLPLEHCPVKAGHWRAWIGTGDHHVALHFDPTENFVCLLFGRKRFTLFPPEVLGSVYVGPLEGGPYGAPISMVDPREPDFKKYPNFQEAIDRSATIELEAGDVLYLPAFWWHHVLSIGVNVAVNYWWTDVQDHEEVQAKCVFLRGLQSLRSLPPHWRRFWRAMFDTFVFQLNGDPYAHLPVEQQGYAGQPTMNHLAMIRERLERYESECKARTISMDNLMKESYQLTPSLDLRIASQDQVVVRNLRGGVELRFPLGIIQVLSLFCTPCSAGEALKIVRANSRMPGEDQLLTCMRDLVLAHILIPCQGTISDGP